MKQLIKNIFVGGLFIFMIAAPVMATISPQPVAAAPGCENRVLGIPPWYRGLTNENPPKCSLKSPDDVGGLSNYIWKIVLNAIEMAVAITAYIAAFFILYGGFLYLTGGALPGQIEAARKTLFNAVIGLVICMGSIAIINLVFSIIK